MLISCLLGLLYSAWQRHHHIFDHYRTRQRYYHLLDDYCPRQRHHHLLYHNRARQRYHRYICVNHYSRGRPVYFCIYYHQNSEFTAESIDCLHLLCKLRDDRQPLPNNELTILNLFRRRLAEQPRSRPYTARSLPLVLARQKQLL